MIRTDSEKPITAHFGEVWTNAQTYRSPLLLSRTRCRVSDEDRATYGKWRSGVIIFYGLLALTVLATGTIVHVVDARRTNESVHPNASSTATRTPNRDTTLARSSPDLAPTTYDQ